MYLFCKFDLQSPVIAPVYKYLLFIILLSNFVLYRKPNCFVIYIGNFSSRFFTIFLAPTQSEMLHLLCSTSCTRSDHLFILDVHIL